MIYTLSKDFFAAATFTGCETFLFRLSNKVDSILWFLLVLLAFLEKRRPNRYWLWGKKINFPYVDIWSDVSKRKYIFKTSNLEC